jgi:hypothetical protein
LFNENKMTERHRQVTPDQVLEQNTGLDENRSDVGQNVPNGISRRGFLKLGLTAAVLAATEGMGLERVEAQEIPTGSDHGLKMYELCEREAGVYGVFNGSLVPMVMR